MKTMRPESLSLRCYAEREKNGTWFAMCIDLNLSVQGDSVEEARRKLHNLIWQYVREAFFEDEAYFDSLVPRKAPLSFVLRYHWIRFLSRLDALKERKLETFRERMPLVPA